MDYSENDDEDDERMTKSAIEGGYYGSRRGFWSEEIAERRRMIRKYRKKRGKSLHYANGNIVF